MENKEALEEVKLRQLFKNRSNCYVDALDVVQAMDENCFIETIKEWQQERMYSEEEIDLLNKMFELYWYENNNEHKDNLEEWELSKKLFKQFKKK